jgi:hypothetical protein
MATHQLWEGGPSVANYTRAQFPSYTFASGDAKLQNIDVAQHYGTPYAVLRRVLDFKNDVGLRNYVNNNAIAATDTLNLVFIPKGCLVLGAYFEVERAADGGAITASLATASGAAFGGAAGAGVAVDLAVAAGRFAAPNGAWVAASGPMSLATAQAVLTPDMAQLVLATKATAGLAGFGNLRLNYSLLIVQARENTATNF